MRRLSPLAASMIVLLALPSPASATTHDVAVVDGAMRFVPEEVEAVAEDAVHWTKPVASPISHNIIHDAGLFVSGEPTGDAIDYTVVFSSGRFGYYCDVHGSTDSGMRGSVDVAPVMRDGPPGLSFVVRWASPETQTGNAFDVRFKIGDGPWIPWKIDTERFLGRFGNRDRPVDVRADRTYMFQARSQVNENADGVRSRWSPSLVVEP